MRDRTHRAVRLRPTNYGGTVKRLISVIVGLLLVFAFGATASASEPRPQDTDMYWSASYWNNKNLSGSPAMTRSEDKLDHNWGAGAPGPGLNADEFSARWTRYYDVPAGTYRITATYDDGMRIFIDGSTVLDEWNDHNSETRSVDVPLAAGHHLVKVEYFENAYDAVARVVLAQVGAGTAAWRGEYFNNMSLSGLPALVRDDANLAFAWGEASPAPGTVNADDFSVRWTRNVSLPAGTYWFTLRSDDGARLWVNGHLLIDAWKDQAVQTYTSSIYLPAGVVPLKMEYYEHTGGAFASLDWSTSAPGPAINHWRGEYFNNRTLSGTPILVRDDANIDFDWSNGSPAAGTVHADDFSVRWTRNLNLPAGTYRFTLTSDDGSRLWVNGHLLVDYWSDQAPSTRTADIYLTGIVPVKLEYYEHLYGAVAKLNWALTTGDGPETVIVDNGDPGFGAGGSSISWRTSSQGWGGDVLWTLNNDSVRPGYNWGRWSPVLSAARYEVFAHIPGHLATTTHARYWISHAGGFTLRVVDQVSAVDRWQTLGTYQFKGTDGDYVTLSDVTYESYLAYKVVWDALKFERR